MVKVSVIIPVYNGEKYVKHCVDSLRRQGLSEDELEIIFVDDRSPDSTFDVLTKNYSGCKNIVIHRQEQNGGPGKARNKGIELASGEYICFLDSDDSYTDGALAELYNTAAENGADMLQTEGVLMPTASKMPEDISSLGENDLVRAITSKAEIRAGVRREPDDISARAENWLVRGYQWNVWCKLYRRSFIMENNIRFSDMKLGEDQHFTLSCIMKAPALYSRIVFMYVYRLDEESLSHGKNYSKMLIKALDSLFAAPALLDKIYEGTDISPEYRRRLSGFHLDTVESGYAVPAYKNLGREAVESNAEVSEVFARHFGEKAEFVSKRLFDLYDTMPYSDKIENAYTPSFWGSFAEKYGRDIIVGGKSGVCSAKDAGLM